MKTITFSTVCHMHPTKIIQQTVSYEVIFSKYKQIGENVVRSMKAWWIWICWHSQANVKYIRLKYIRCWVFLFLVILNIKWEWNNIIIKWKDEKKLGSVNVIRSDISSTYEYNFFVSFFPFSSNYSLLSRDVTTFHEH